MSKKLFAGGLPFTYSDEELRALFAGAGKVLSAVMVQDPAQGRTRGFGFIAMSTPEESQAAIAKLNGMKVGEKNIFVTEAREKPAMVKAGRPSRRDVPRRTFGGPPQGETPRTFRGPRRSRGDFGRSHRSGKPRSENPSASRLPPKKEFWRKFAKKKTVRVTPP